MVYQTNPCLLITLSCPLPLTDAEMTVWTLRCLVFRSQANYKLEKRLIHHLLTLRGYVTRGKVCPSRQWVALNVKILTSEKTLVRVFLSCHVCAVNNCLPLSAVEADQPAEKCASYA